MHGQHGAGADLGVGPGRCGVDGGDNDGGDWHDGVLALGWSQSVLDSNSAPTMVPGLFFGRASSARGVTVVNIAPSRSPSTAARMHAPTGKPGAAAWRPRTSRTR
jgi:hypothetical protein